MATMTKISSAPSMSSRLTETEWKSIQDPGAYLLLKSGDLVRMFPDSLAPGHSPLLTITSRDELRVAKLSDNPAEPITVLRNIAADNDYFVNF